ncbi:MAG: hypothetical protein AAGI91_11640 [Bacteroidota bacterium]
MPFIETQLATDWTPATVPSKWARLVERFLARLLPAGSPDFSARDYERVQRWWIELDPKHHRPEREIGLDDQGQPVVVGPLGDNLGFWTDSDMQFDPAAHDRISKNDFETMWTQAVQQIVRDKGLVTKDPS